MLNLKEIAGYQVFCTQQRRKRCNHWIDYTTKAASHLLHDVKTDHITIAAPSGERKVMMTGYMENVSHI